MESLPTMKDLNSERTIEEHSKDLTEMVAWQVPVSNGIPADLFHQYKSCLLPLQHDILVKCWIEGGKVPYA